MADAYLFGRPVSHSLSPALHNAAFAALGLPHRYVAREVADDELREAVASLRGPQALGANVTIPHKERVMRHLDGLSDEARRCGSVNTIVRSASRLLGENTDVAGFERALAERADLLRAAPVLVLGAGGGARACVLALLRRDCAVLVTNRTNERAAALADAVTDERGRRAQVVAWPGHGALTRVAAVVNATPVGLAGEDPLDGQALPRVVIDLVPTARETALVRRARSAAQCTAVDGLLMLLYQAARSVTLWTGADAPIAAMRAALPRSP